MNELTWNKLLEITGYSRATLTKYINLLNNKAIISYSYKDTYTLNDMMLKTWFKHKKECEG